MSSKAAVIMLSVVTLSASLRDRLAVSSGVSCVSCASIVPSGRSAPSCSSSCSRSYRWGWWCSRRRRRRDAFATRPGGARAVRHPHAARDTLRPFDVVVAAVGGVQQLGVPHAGGVGQSRLAAGQHRGKQADDAVAVRQTVPRCESWCGHSAPPRWRWCPSHASSSCAGSSDWQMQRQPNIAPKHVRGWALGTEHDVDSDDAGPRRGSPHPGR